MKKNICLFIGIFMTLSMFTSCTKATHRSRNRNGTENDAESSSLSSADTDIPDTNANNNNSNSSNTSNNDTDTINKDKFIENQIVNMFLTYGHYNAEYGIYYFSDFSPLDNTSLLRQFIYSPSLQMFTISTLLSTYTSYEMIDYGSVTFSWGNFEDGLFHAYHELKDIAMIEFTYTQNQLNPNITLGNNYKYQVKSNTYPNLNNTNDIKEYAVTCYECIKTSVGYAQSIIYSYLGSSYTLW